MPRITVRCPHFIRYEGKCFDDEILWVMEHLLEDLEQAENCRPSCPGNYKTSMQK